MAGINMKSRGICRVF